jgi:hypothetical protein
VQVCVVIAPKEFFFFVMLSLSKQTAEGVVWSSCDIGSYVVAQKILVGRGGFTCAKRIKYGI